MRKVDRLPLDRLWRADHELGVLRARSLTHADIRELLRRGPLDFVVANIGDPLHWVSRADRFDFWKREAIRIADSHAFDLDDFPDRMAYVASEWTGDTVPIILLEAHH
jgi:hypothetical protein